MIATRDVVANGITFRVRTCGSGERLVLCLHGFPEAGIAWDAYLPLFARLGYRAWAPDLRGYGATTQPSATSAYALEKLVADVAALAVASEARSVTLVAHDWGAVLAWFAAMRPTCAIERLVIMNVPHPARYLAAVRRPEQLVRSWYAAFFQLPWLPERLLALNDGRVLEALVRASSAAPERFPREALAYYRARAASPANVRAMLAWYRAAGRGGGFARAIARGFPRIAIPTLLLWGERDVALAKSSTYGTDAYVDDLTVRYFPHASHWVEHDAYDEVAAELERFLSS
jgi:pimeloyl-ACP methyl ester carboxylesterase